ncbi:hypothetical protein M404DRAFT_890746 [Pisolithus tinctorius Marx 270]|uniref:Uncharacterized protein n=1 Tax=Pisolithus tinctorius Marx 270 TaxID=870435 RepID=A0A0C3IKP9_PISTI|nr:hypothetical protein M404DRAFT_890746 [Pisolithus tinctorius Marx 270]
MLQMQCVQDIKDCQTASLESRITKFVTPPTARLHVLRRQLGIYHKLLLVFGRIEGKHKGSQHADLQ